MKLKKANAICGLAVILLLLLHAGYQMVAYVLFLYNPFVTKLFAWTLAGLLALHIIFGMSIVMFAHDGSELAKYPKENRRTILQRASAIAILILFVAHIYAFKVLTNPALGDSGLYIAGIIQILFFAAVFVHVAMSFSNAFVTLGWLTDLEHKKKIDKVVTVICVIAFIAATIIVLKTYGAILAMNAQ